MNTTEFTQVKVTNIRWDVGEQNDLPKEVILNIENDWIEEQSQSLFEDSEDYSSIEEAKNEIITTAIYEDLEVEHGEPVIDFDFVKL